MGSCLSRQEPDLICAPIIDDMEEERKYQRKKNKYYHHHQQPQQQRHTNKYMNNSRAGGALVKSQNSSVSSKLSSRLGEDHSTTNQTQPESPSLSADNFELKVVSLKKSHSSRGGGSSSKGLYSSSHYDLRQNLREERLDDEEEDNLETEEERKVRLYECIYRRKWQEASDLLETPDESTILTTTTSNNNNNNNNKQKSQIANYVDRNKRTCLHWACMRNAPPPLVHTLLMSYTDAASMTDNMGKLPIHLACEYGSSDSLVCLVLGATTVSSSSTMVKQDIQFGRTPLAEAIVNGRYTTTSSMNVIESIVNANPRQMTMVDKRGHAPIVSFFRQNLGRLLQYKASTSSQCTLGNSDSCNSLEDPSQQREQQQQQDYDGTYDGGDGNKTREMKELVAIAGLLLRAEHQALTGTTTATTTATTTTTVVTNVTVESNTSTDEEEKEKEYSNIIMDAIQSPTCPFAFVEFLLQFYPEQADMMRYTNNNPTSDNAGTSSIRSHDNSGDLPIHAAASVRPELDHILVENYKCDGCGSKSSIRQYYRSNPKVLHRQILCQNCIDAGTQTTSTNYYEELHPVNKVHGSIAALLNFNQDFAKYRNSEGLLPLHLAIKAGHKWSDESLQLLIAAYPEAIEIRDETTGLYPFMLAAVSDDTKKVGSGDDENDDNDNEEALLFQDSKAAKGDDNVDNDLRTCTTIFELLQRFPLQKRVNHGSESVVEDSMDSLNHDRHYHRKELSCSIDTIPEGCDETLNSTFLQSEDDNSVMQLLADVTGSDESSQSDEIQDVTCETSVLNESNRIIEKEKEKLHFSENDMSLSSISDKQNDSFLTAQTLDKTSSSDSQNSKDCTIKLKSNLPSEQDIDAEDIAMPQTLIEEETDTDATVMREEPNLSEVKPKDGEGGALISQKVKASMRDLLTSSQGISSIIELGMSAIS